MRFAILADVHANWPALEAVLEDLDEQGEVHELYCLGDMVGYYPFPRECLDALMERRAHCILGNHERYLLGLSDGSRLRPSVLRPLELARERLSAEQMSYLGGLKDRRKVRDLFLQVHGSPRDPDEYLFKAHWAANLDVLHADHPGFGLCWFGHTHKAAVASRERGVYPIRTSRRVRLGRTEVCLVNPGSVGQPRDRTPLAGYAIYDDETRIVYFRRVEYAVAETQAAVRRLGWSKKLSWRLGVGK